MTEKRLSLAAMIAEELHIQVSQVETVIRLLDDGATVPFIARYRKEATDGLNDTQLRMLVDRLHYLRDMEERRTVILQTLREQEKLTKELEAAILSAETKTLLEDLYLPYRPKRRTKALLAKEAGLLPLAEALWHNPTLVPDSEAQAYINVEAGVVDGAAALEGARQILMEEFSENALLLDTLRKFLWKHAVLTSKGGKQKNAKTNKFLDFLDYSELIHKIPSHRALALFRGRRESALQLSLALPDAPDYGEKQMALHFKISDEKRPADAFLLDTIKMAWKSKVFTKLELELLSRLRELADEEAIRVFAANLCDLLLAAPAGPKVIMGLDPGIRTGVKVVVVDETGKLLDYTTVFPVSPQNEWHQAIASLAKLAAKYQVTLISIGNGTGSRDTERLVAELMKMYPDLHLAKVLVSEAGASVYSASELAANEFPDLDVSLRGAVSIARRLQDPLAELVKIEPKSIGVGQYQHDVNQTRLARSLEGVVEDCVNAVGVDLNTASVALLTRVSGLNETLAKNLVQYRDEHGSFQNREQLKHVARMGEKTFQQSAGFLRVLQGDNPLDSSSVHPEAYPLVEKILKKSNKDIREVMGNGEFLHSVNASEYVEGPYGLPTVHDVLRELEKPGRDPRPSFKTVHFKEGVEDINDLEEGMILDGVVSNVTNFGAFVDIGVHQDGLVHISAMTDRFITDPRTVVKTGAVVQVKVVSVDKERRRIGLSMKLEESPQTAGKPRLLKITTPVVKPKPSKKIESVKAAPMKKPTTVFNTAMADALSKWKEGAE